MKKSLLALPLAFLLTFNYLPLPLQAQEAPVDGAAAQSTPAPVVLDHTSLGQLADLVINPQQTVAIDFGSLTGGLTLPGNLTNNGSIYAYSTNPNVNIGSINANNIYNNAGGLITSVIPQGGIPGLSLNLANLVSNFSLNLTAVNNIVNAGMISSAGNLSMTAGGTITNAATQANLAAMLTAVNTVNLTASNIVNSGIISAMQGNINLASKLSTDLILNNVNGQLSALNGIINARDLSYLGAMNTILHGGDFLSRELNIYSGDGIVDVNVNDILGTVNINAGCAHVQAATDNLLLGSLIITGDPTYYNTLGSITVTGPVSTTSGQNLAFAARQDITVSGNISTIASTSTNGTLIFIAGANITGPTPLANTQINNNTANTVTIASGSGSTTGGAINLTGSGNTITTSGGNLTMVAFSGSGAGSALTPGTISVQQSISTAGSGTGFNGSVTMIAGATSGAGITTSAINTGGGSGSNGGAITLRTAAPSTNSSTSLTNGTLTGGFTAGSTTAASVTTGALTTIGSTSTSGRAGGAINITAGTSITTGAIATIGGTGTSNTAADGGAGGAAGSVTFNAGGNISVGNISAYGGTGGSFTGTSGSAYYGGAGGAGAAVSLVTTGDSSSISSGFINTSGGATGTGGYNSGTISGSSAGAQAGGSAGTITLTAPGGISAGYLRAFGAGGEGGNNGSSGVIGTQGGNGGAGAAVSLTSTAGAITLTGDINTSGGGGGGTGNSGGTATGGTGGAAGNISINGAGVVQITGPVLAAAGGGGNGSSASCCGGGGGASFGGGGGGADGGSAGGGLFGGGGTSNWGSASGGSAVSGGVSKNPQGSAGVTNGSVGQGGNSFDTTPNASRTGGVFGVGGVGTNATANQVGQAGQGNMGGAAGSTNGNITISGGSVSLTGTVSSFYPGSTGGSTGFTSSPYSDVSIYGGTTGQAVQITATSGDVSIAGTLNLSGVDRSGQTNGAAGGAAAGLTVSASSGSISLGGITAVGGSGASTTSAVGGAGGAGGAISLTAGQNVTVAGAINLAGGLGGTSTSSSFNGGVGGAGGSLSLNANGIVSLAGSVSTAGGTGGTNSSRTGGTGGQGGSVTITDTAGPITITGNVSTAGGTGGTGSTQGNGAAGGAMSIQTTNYGAVTVSGNLNTSGGNGPTVGQPGAITVRANSNFASQGFASPGSPIFISGYILAQAGGTSRSALTSGAGAITLAGNAVAINGTTNISGTNYSIFGGSSVNITSPGATIGQNYASASDLSSTNTVTNGISTVGFSGNNTSATFAMGSSGSKGQIASRINGTSDTITINTAPNSGHPTAHNILDTSPQTFTGGSAGLLYRDSGNTVRSVTSASTMTAAKRIAVIQNLYAGTQTLIVDTTNTPIATGGSFEIASVNFPTAGDNGGNFSTLVIPASVTANVTTTTVIPANGPTVGPITINGTLSFNATSGSSSGGINAAGNITTGASGLITSTQTTTVSLTSTANSIGSSGSPLKVSLSNLALNAANGSVYANDQLSSGNITLNNSGVNTSTGTFQFQVTATSGNLLTGASQTISGKTLVITSTSGSIGTSGSTVAVNTGLLTASASSGNVYITDSAKVILQDNGAFTNGASTSSGTFSITDTNAAGSGNTAIAFSGPTTISAATVILNASTSGDVGTSATPIAIIAGTVALNAPNGSVYVNDSLSTGNITINNSGANTSNGRFQFRATATSGNILTGGSQTITGNNVILASTNGSIGSTSSLVAVNTGLLTAQATNGSSYITDSARVTLQDNNGFSNAASSSGTFYVIDTNAAGAGTTAIAFSGPTGIAAGTLVLRASVSGDIGTTSNRITTSATNITANAQSGSVYITDTSNSNVNLQNTTIGSTIQNSAGNTFSLVTNQNLTTVNSFAAINNLSLTSTNGAVDLSGILSAGSVTASGGSLTVSAGTNIVAPGNVSAVTYNTSGVNGTNGTSSGGTGNAGGAITLTAGLTSTSGVITLPNLSLTANGGNGGTASSSGGTGGQGATGGNITVAASGTISLNAISANGGNGGSKIGGGNGTGGAAGAGATAMIISTGDNVNLGTITATGGTGGNGAVSGSNGNGGAGGKIDIESQKKSISITGNVDASGGIAGTGGSGGSVGQPTGTSGHSIQLMAVGSLAVTGYVAAAAGGSAANTITATNADIIMYGKTVNLSATGTSLFGGTGGYNAFGGSSMTIVAPGTSTLTQYSTNLDLTTTSTVSMVAFTGGTFTVGTTPVPGGNGAAAQLGTKAGSTLSINGINTPNPVNSTSTPRTFAGNLVVIYNGNSFMTVAPAQAVTPAQWVAAVQVSTTSSQDVTLNAGGTGTQVSGIFTLADSNYPLITAAGGTSTTFTNINIPLGVTENVTTTNTVTSTGNVTINGSLNFQSGSSGALTASGNNLTIAANGTIQSASGNLAITAIGTGSGLVVGSSGIVASAGGNLSITTGAVNNGGLITTSQNNGTITIQNANTMTLTGNGSITSTGTGVSSILIQTTGNTHSLTINGSWTYDPGIAGSTTISAITTGSPLTFGASTTQNIASGTLTVSSRTVVLGDGALIQSQSSTGTAITIDNGAAGATLVVQGPSGGSATIQTNGADIQIQTTNTRQITFDKSSTAATTLNFNTQGLGTVITSNNTDQNINSLVTFASDSNIQMNINGNNNLNLNGTINSSKSSGSIVAQSTTDLNIAGTGTIAFTGGASGTIQLIANGANSLAFIGNTTMDPGAAGSAIFKSQTAGGIISIASGTIQTVQSGASILVSAQNFRFLGDGAALVATGSSNITFDSGTAGNNLLVRTQAGTTTGGISTAGGTILFTPLTDGTLTFSKTTGADAILILSTGGSGLVKTVSAANTAINAGVILSADSNIEVNVNGGNTATVNGTITTNKAAANLLIQSTTNLTLAGTGILAVTGSGSKYITVQAQGANALTVAASLTYNADVDTYVQLQSTASGGSVAFNNNTAQTITGSAYGQVIATQITFSGNATFTNSAGYLDLTGDQLSTNITLTNSRTVTLDLPGGVAFIGSYAAQPLVITKTTGTGNSTLQVNNELQTFSNGADTTIDTRVILSSNNNITVNTDGGALNVNGTITSSAANGNITISSRNGSLVMGGSPTGSISVTGGGLASILVLVQGISTALTMNSNYTFNAGASGTVNVIADQITFGAGTTTTITGTSALAFYGQNIIFGNAATITSANTVSLFASGGSNLLTITTPDNGSANINVSSGQIVVQGTSLAFAKTAGVNSSTLNLNNANVYMQSSNGNTSINSNVIVQSNRNITLEVSGNHNFALEGTLKSSNNAGVINISGSGGVTISGSTAGTVQMTGSGANNISLIGYDSGLTVNNSITLDAGSSGTATIGASCCAMTLAANKTITFANQTAGRVQATTLLLSGNNTITGSKTSGTALTIYSPNPNPFTLNLQANTSSTIASSGGAINIDSPKNITIGISGGTGSSTATLNFTGGNVTMTANEGTTVISSRVTINSQKDITFNVNQATIGANGQINTSLGSITLIAATGTISIGNNVTMYANEGNLTIQNTNAAAGAIDIASGANLTGYTTGNPALGFVNIVIGPIPAMPVVGSVPANVTVNESGGGVVYFGQNSINASAPNNTINAKGRNVVFSTGGQGSSAITLGGNVTITADPPLPSDATASQSTAPTLSFATTIPTTTAVHQTISTTVIPFDTSPASSVGTLVGNDTLNNSVNQALNAAFPATEDELRKHKDNDVYSNLDPTVSPYQPISYSPGLEYQRLKPADSKSEIYTFETAGTSIKCVGGARVLVNEPGVVAVKQGDVVIAANKGKTTVRSGDAIITIDSSTIAFISQEGNSLKIRNLYETGGDSMCVVVDGKQFHVAVGHEVIISENEAVYKESKHDKVGRRHTKAIDSQCDKHIATCEFSLLSLIETSKILRQICHSNEADDKAIEARLVKMAACLMLTTSSHGAYTDDIKGGQ
ncbi:MAG: hypothetical protein K2Y22_13545 [Candidatus Obscuribacterales bacterium]|nr:hypothetical protein [Candidatus Obscuribacterales bacterium]